MTTFDLSQSSGAIISECGAYRYLLWRELHPDIWDEPPPENHTVAFVMLNRRAFQ